MATATVERHPENVHAPWVVAVTATQGDRERRIWFACETQERAEQKRPELEKRFTEQGF